MTHRLVGKAFDGSLQLQVLFTKAMIGKEHDSVMAQAQGLVSIDLSPMQITYLTGIPSGNVHKLFKANGRSAENVARGALQQHRASPSQLRVRRYDRAPHAARPRASANVAPHSLRCSHDTCACAKAGRQSGLGAVGRSGHGCADRRFASHHL